MAFPQVASVGSSSETADTTSHDVVMPSGISSGDLLLLMMGIDGNPTISGLPSGWEVLIDQDRAGTDNLYVAAKVADGTESNFTLTSSASEESINRVWRITGHAHSSLDDYPIMWEVITGLSTNPNAPLLEPEEYLLPQDLLWIAVATHENATATFPADYTIQQFSGATGGAAAASISTAARELNASSEDPGAFVRNSSNWVAATIAIASDGNSSTSEFPVISPLFRLVTSGADTTTPTVGIPAHIKSGNLLVALCGFDGNPTVSDWPTGWVVVDQASGNNTTKLLLAYKVSDGTETDFQLTLSASEHSNIRTWKILRHGVTALSVTGDVAPGGANTAPDPPSVAPGLGTRKFLWIAADVCESGNNTVYPTNYTYKQRSANSGGTLASSVTMGTASRKLETDTEDPGAFTTSTGSFWAAGTLAIPPIAGQHLKRDTQMLQLIAQ